MVVVVVCVCGVYPDSYFFFGQIFVRVGDGTGLGLFGCIFRGLFCWLWGGRLVNVFVDGWMR